MAVTAGLEVCRVVAVAAAEVQRTGLTAVRAGSEVVAK